MSRKPYPRYRDPGCAGLTGLPEHWALAPVKHLSNVELSNVDKHTVEGQREVRLCNYVDVYKNERISGGLAFMLASASAQQIKRLALRRGDVLITKDSESPDDIGVPALVADDLEAVVCGYHLALLRPAPTRLSGGYLQRVLQSHYARAAFQCAAVGMTRFGLGKYEIENIRVPVPPVHEQDAIAAFLDRETAKIDTLIAKQERLIELLLEKADALVFHAVAKGLNPAAAMRDSGVPWLGPVPVHWAVMRIKWLAQMESGHTPDKKVPEYWEDCQIPWVSLRDTGVLKNNDYISETAQCINEAGMANSSAHILPPGTVVFSRDATIGRCAILSRPMAVSQHYIGWVCGPRLLPEFLLRVLRSMGQELERLTFGATVKTIGMPDVRTLTIPLPPLDEQKRIVEFIDVQRSKVDGLIERARTLITLMREHRAALITAAVTGKIDLRDTVEDVA